MTADIKLHNELNMFSWIIKWIIHYNVIVKKLKRVKRYEYAYVFLTLKAQYYDYTTYVDLLLFFFCHCINEVEANFIITADQAGKPTLFSKAPFGTTT